MNRKLTSTLALAGALAVGIGSAHAATLNDSMNVTINVEANCAFSGPGDQFFTLDGANGVTEIMADRYVLVSCNEGLPYIIEADTNAGGILTLTDAGTGQSLPVAFFYEPQDGGGAFNRPWGTQANNEQWAGTGTGEYQFKNFRMFINDQDLLPQVGTYVQTLNLTLTY